MKKILGAIDKVVGFIFLEFGGIVTLGTFLLVLYTVLCRYVLHTNTGGIDELATYFVVSSVWAGAVLTSRAVNDGQIKIDFLRVIVKNEKVNLCVEVLWQLISLAAMGIFVVLSYNYFTKQLARGSTLSGINFPIWVFTGIMFLCTVFIVIYEIRKTVYLVKKIAEKPEGGAEK